MHQYWWKSTTRGNRLQYEPSKIKMRAVQRTQQHPFHTPQHNPLPSPSPASHSCPMVHNKNSSQAQRQRGGPSRRSTRSPRTGGPTQAHGQRRMIAGAMTHVAQRSPCSPPISLDCSTSPEISILPPPVPARPSQIPVLSPHIPRRFLVPQATSPVLSQRSPTSRGSKPMPHTQHSTPMGDSSAHIGQRSQIQPQNLPNLHNHPRNLATTPLLQVVTLIDHSGFVQALGTTYVPAQSVLRLVDGAIQAVPESSPS